MRYMLDTNICIYVIRRHPREVVAKLADCVEVTNNERDFRAYPGLLIENWASTVAA